MPELARKLHTPQAYGFSNASLAYNDIHEANNNPERRTTTFDAEDQAEITF